MNVIKKYTTDILAVVNAEKDIWLSKVGLVPKFVTYTNTVPSDSVNQILLANNYYPTMWSLDPKDFSTSEADIKLLLAAATKDVVIINEFAESNITGVTLEWFYNNTKATFNDLCSCYGISNKFWNNCTSATSEIYGTTAYSSSSTSNSGPSTKPTDTFSPASRLSWFF
eukprot:NODE_26_length_35450_cov_0.398320.p17 type:complete len:169 gc:universal NODE_26_length_35450_cov_0.398320:26747-26241(-)